MTKQISIGLIGCGAQSIKHIPAWKKFNVNLIVADLDSQLAKQRADEFGLDAAVIPAMARRLIS